MRSLRPVLLLSFLVLAACAADPAANQRAFATKQAIVGGATSTTAQDAAIMIVTNGQYGCTGTLIAPNLVLTARHCVAGEIDDTTPCGPVKNDLPASAFGVALAVNADESKKVARGTKIFVPPTKNLCGFDVALIQLDAEIPEAKVARVRFEKLAVGETAVAVGYGAATPDGPPSASRRQRQTSVQAVGPAAKSWPSKSGPTIAYEVPAGDVATGESTCFGDSGGPLFDEAGNVVGVTSRGIDGECVDRPSVYASVAAHAKMIEDAATAAGHPLSTLSEDDVSQREGDPGDDAAEQGGDEANARRSYKPQASTGCSAAPRNAESSAATVLLAALALTVAASFRRRGENK